MYVQYTVMSYLCINMMLKRSYVDCDDATVCMSSICMYKVHTYVHVVDIRSVC